jgi:hypothetical protein
MILTSTITVNSPNGGETLVRGTSQSVTGDYTDSPGSTVKITLLKAGSDVGTIITSANTPVTFFERYDDWIDNTWVLNIPQGLHGTFTCILIFISK